MTTFIQPSKTKSAFGNTTQVEKKNFVKWGIGRHKFSVGKISERRQDLGRRHCFADLKFFEGCMKIASEGPHRPDAIRQRDANFQFSKTNTTVNG
jgi:hypothetical protein